MTKFNTKIFFKAIKSIFVLFLFVNSLSSSAIVRYAYTFSSGLGNGSSWSNSGTLQAMIIASASGDQVWVKSGVYKPTHRVNSTSPSSSLDRFNTFTIKSGVSIYGGFAGTETLLSQRNFTSNITTLSGNIGGPSNTDNCYHVVSVNVPTANTILDGFNIKDGYADFNGFFLGITQGLIYGAGVFINQGGTNFKLQNCNLSSNNCAGNGGAVYNFNSSPTITNCTFTSNSSNRGGGLYNVNSSPIITNSTFSTNSASRGAGIFDSLSSPTITNCTISSNSGGFGAGMFNINSSSPIITNSTFASNTSILTRGAGAGMYNFAACSPLITNCTFSANTLTSTNPGGTGAGMFNNNSSPTIINSTFTENINSSSNGAGGGMFNASSSPILINCTITRNNSTSDGGGFFNTTSSNPIIKNSIIWKNTGGGTQGISNVSSTPTVRYCNVQGTGVYLGTGNVNINPIFRDSTDLDGIDNIWRTADDGIQLSCLSPVGVGGVRNNGDNVGVSSFDIIGNPRIANITVDMGAYEYQDLSSSSTQTNVTCFGGTNGTATVTATGGASPYLYSWSPSGGSAATATGLLAGTYICTITDAKTCSITQSVIINQPVSIISTTNLAICPSDLPYTWNSLSFTATGTQTKTGLIAVSGCDSSALLNLTISPSVIPSVSISTTPSTSICEGTIVTFNTSIANGGSSPSYIWIKNSSVISGEISSNYTSSSFNSGDTISVKMTSNAICRSVNQVESNKSIITIIPKTWFGAISTDWNNPSNWCGNTIPTSTSDVVINSGTPFQPTITSPGAFSRDVTIVAGAVVTLPASQQWEVKGNWSKTGTLLAGAGSTMLFTGTTPQTISDTNNFRNIIINNSLTGSVTIQPSAKVTAFEAVKLLSGILTTNNNLIIDVNNGSGISGLGMGTISGGIGVKRTIFGEGYHYIGVPFTGSNKVNYAYLNDSLWALSPYDLYTYDETNTSQDVSQGYYPAATPFNTNYFNPMQGYAYYTFDTLNPVFRDPNFDQNDSAKFTLKRTACVPSLSIALDTAAGWNFISNPFPSTIDWDNTGWIKPSGLLNAIYYYNPFTESYEAYTSGIPAGMNLIPTMQAFFVRTDTDNEVLTVLKSSRNTPTTSSFFYRTAANENILKLKASIKKDNFDDTYIRLSEVAYGFNRQMDAYKLLSENNRVKIFSIKGLDKMAINTLPIDTDQIIVPLELIVPKDTLVSLIASEIGKFTPGISVFLLDQQNQTSQDLLVDSTFEINLNKGDYKNRFFIKIQNATVLSKDNLKTTQRKDVKIYSINNIVSTEYFNIKSKKASIKVLNLLGQIVLNQSNVDISLGKYQFTMGKISTGIYIVKVEVDSKIYSEKILLEN